MPWKVLLLVQVFHSLAPLHTFTTHQKGPSVLTQPAGLERAPAGIILLRHLLQPACDPSKVLTRPDHVSLLKRHMQKACWRVPVLTNVYMTEFVRARALMACPGGPVKTSALAPRKSNGEREGRRRQPIPRTVPWKTPQSSDCRIFSSNCILLEISISYQPASIWRTVFIHRKYWTITRSRPSLRIFVKFRENYGRKADAWKSGPPSEHQTVSQIFEKFISIESKIRN